MRKADLCVAAKAVGQKISSTMMSRPESILIRQDWKGLLLLKHPFRCSDSPLICGSMFSHSLLCAAARRVPMLVKRKVAMLRAFTIGLLESFKSCLLFLVALPGLIDTLAQLLA